MACSAEVQEAIWLRRFLQDLRVVTCASVLVTIYCDSMAVILYSKDSEYHGKTKYIDLKYQFVHKVVAQKKIIL